MRKEYDFSKSRKNPYAKQLKRQITLRRDTVAVDYFKPMAAELGTPLPETHQLLLARLRPAEAASPHPMPRGVGAVSSEIARVTPGFRPAPSVYRQRLIGSG